MAIFIFQRFGLKLQARPLGWWGGYISPKYGHASF